MTPDEMMKNSAAYQMGYNHGMLAVNELVQSLQTKLAQAKAEIARLHDITSERNYG